MNNRRFILILLGLMIVPCASDVRAGDWLHWRGPERNDHVDEDSGWDAGAWPPKEPVWTATVGEGASSPLVVAGRLYCLGWRDGQDRVTCLDARSGRELWSVGYDSPAHGRQSTGDEGLYSGPTSTPEFDSETGFLFTLGCDGDLNCWNTRDNGRKVWGINLYEQFGVPRRPKFGRSPVRDYGYTTAPLVVGEWVIVEVGDDDGNLIAFSKRNGERVWASEYKRPAGHTGGLVPLDVEGVPCVAVLTYDGLHVARIDAANAGKTVALFPWGTDFANNVATPAVHGSDILLTSAYNHNAICKVHVTLQGASKIWEQPFASKVCSPVIVGGEVYWAWRNLHCLSFESGKQLWEGGEFGDAGSCIVTRDQRLIVWGHRGRLVLVECAARSEGAYRELARLDNVFASDVWPHVVLADGRLVCKDRSGNVKCFSIHATKE